MTDFEIAVVVELGIIALYYLLALVRGGRGLLP